MRTVKAFFDGEVFIPVTPIRAKKNQVAIITLIDDVEYSKNNKTYLEYAGRLSHEDYLELSEILKDNDQVDANEW
ncbi:MAG: hypothetical protein LBE79_05290 [Tannerella sp.]|nr:hypothetical protein [Tannerella sp.]